MAQVSVGWHYLRYAHIALLVSKNFLKSLRLLTSSITHKLTQALVEKTGYRMTLRYLGIICFVLLMTACALGKSAVAIPF